MAKSKGVTSEVKKLIAIAISPTFLGLMFIVWYIASGKYENLASQGNLIAIFPIVAVLFITGAISYFTYKKGELILKK